MGKTLVIRGADFSANYFRIITNTVIKQTIGKAYTDSEPNVYPYQYNSDARYLYIIETPVDYDGYIDSYLCYSSLTSGNKQIRIFVISNIEDGIIKDISSPFYPDFNNEVILTNKLNVNAGDYVGFISTESFGPINMGKFESYKDTPIKHRAFSYSPGNFETFKVGDVLSGSGVTSAFEYGFEFKIVEYV